MSKKYRIRVYDWNPNGTNDIEVGYSTVDGSFHAVSSLQEATFGIDVTKRPYMDKYPEYSECAMSALVPLKTVLSHIAVSPVSDGSETINFLKKYFKSVKAA